MYNPYVNLIFSRIKISQLVHAFFRIYFIIIMVMFSWAAISVIRFPYGVDYGEAPLMDQVRRLENHASLYKSELNVAPYIIANYPPLYPVLVAGIDSILNSSILQTSRIISLFFSLVSGGLIGLFGFHLTKNKVYGAIAAAIFIGNPYVLIWSPLARVDMMALAFSLLALFILYKRGDSVYWILTACMLFLVSAFTRQTYLLSGPLAGFIWLYHLNHRRSFLFLSVIGILTLLIFGMINAITRGAFYLNIIVANINRYEISRTISMIKQLFVLWPVILIASYIVFYLGIRDHVKKNSVSKSDEKDDSFAVFGLGVYSMGAFAIALTVGKVGSDVNYFLELIAVCAIWMAIVFSMIMHRLTKKRWFFMGLFFIQLLWSLVGSIPLVQGFIGNRWDNISFYNNLYQRISLSTQKGIVLSDDYLDMVVIAGQAIYYQPFEYGQLYHADLWDTTSFVNEIEKKEFSLIVIGGDTIDKECCWPPPIRNALTDNYQKELESNVILLIPEQ